VNRRGVLLGACAAWAGLTGWTRLEAWSFDRAASSIEMSVGAFGQTRRGRFAEWNGNLAFDPASPERTRAEVTVQAASLALSPDPVRRRAVGPAFLDAGRHPAIRLDLQSLRPLGGDRYEASARLTLKGRTRPVVFPVDLRVTGDRAHLAGALTIDRADYGIGTSGPWSRLVGRQVTVRVALQARRAPT
jgi:polyisoprenoid-binding protein YceI